MQTLKKLLPLLRPYRWQLVGVVILGALMSLCQGLVAPLGALLFDNVFSNLPPPEGSQIKKLNDLLYSFFGREREQLIIVIPLAFVVLYSINGVFRYAHFYYTRVIGEKITIEVRQRLQQKYLNLSLTFHHQYEGGTGALISRTLNDVSQLQNAIYLIADYVREPILMILLFVNLFILDWKLTLWTLFTTPIFIFIMRQIGRGLRKYGHQSQSAMDTVTTTIKESLDGVKVIQAYGLENQMKERLSKNVSRYLETRKSIIAHEEAAGPLSEFVGTCLFAALCYYVGNGVVNGTSSAGVFVGFIVALGLMQKPIKTLQNAFVKIQQIFVVTERIFKILEDQGHVPELTNAKAFPENWQTLSFKNVSFSFGSEPVITAVNLTVKRGEVIAIVGESGSGKTTLMNLLERFFDPEKGHVFLDDTKISDLKLKDLRKHIALVTQDVFLFDDSVESNIHSGDFEKSKNLVVDSAKAANAHGFIEKLSGGYQYKVGERGQKLSGGERQRISIARAIYRDAPILILDEATSALDSVSEIEVQKGLDRLMFGRTCFVIAHRLSTIRKADRILVVQKGTIVEDGNHDKLLELRGAYFKYFQLQTNG